MYSLKRFHSLVIFLLLVSFLQSGCGAGKGPGAEQKAGRRPVALVLHTIIGGTILDGRLSYPRTIDGTILGQKLSRPFGLASDNAGNIYVIDAGNNRLLKFDRDFQVVGEAGGFGSADGLLNAPSYMALGNDQRIYINDAGNRRISIFGDNLKFSGQVNLVDSENQTKYGYPTGLAVNPYGELWIANPDKSGINVVNNHGDSLRFIGGAESSSEFLLTPAGMRKDGFNNILVCDAGRSAVKVFDRYGAYQSDLGSDILQKPSGINFDRDGNIWIIDEKIPAILCLDRNGSLVYSSVAAVGNDNFALSQPLDIAITPEDFLIVTDSGHDRLMIYKIYYADQIPNLPKNY